MPSRANCNQGFRQFTENLKLAVKIFFENQKDTDLFHAKVRIDRVMTEEEKHPFLHVGRCICVDVVKEFLNDNHINTLMMEMVAKK